MKIKAEVKSGFIEGCGCGSTGGKHNPNWNGIHISSPGAGSAGS